MGYIGPIPAQVPLTSNDLADSIVTADKLATDAVETAKVKDVNVTAGKLATTQDLSSKTITLPASVSGLGTGITNAQLAGSIDVTSKITGVVPAANLGTGTASSTTILYGDGTYKAEPTTNLTPVRQDILTLALKQAVQENSTKFNLPNSSICKFEADADFNLAGSTTVARNDSEYIWAAAGSTAQVAITKVGSPTHSTSYAKWGSSSLYFGSTNSDYIHWDMTADHMDLGTSNWTVEFWRYFTANTIWNKNFSMTANSDWSTGNGYLDDHISDNTSQYYYRLCGPSITNHNTSAGNTTNTSSGIWEHWAIVREGSNDIYYRDGNRKATNVIGAGAIPNLRYGWLGYNANTIYWDDFRVSDTARYTGSSYTIPSGRLSSDSNTKLLIQSIDQGNGTSTFVDTGAGVGTLAANATGTALGTTNVPSSAVTDVSGVILLKDAYGSTTLGTDVKAYFTADNSNWTEATSYADAGTFSTGIKMIKLGKATCTEGSDVRWKIVWANQVASSKEAQIYGIGLNY